MGTMQMKNQNIDWVQIALNQYCKRFIMKAGSDKEGPGCLMKDHMRF